MCHRCRHSEHDTILSLLCRILINQEDYMTEFQDVQDKLAALDTKVTELQSAVDADQASDAQVVKDLNDQIIALKTEISALEEQGAEVSTSFRQAVDEIQAITDRIGAVTADVSNAHPEGSDSAPEPQIPEDLPAESEIPPPAL